MFLPNSSLQASRRHFLGDRGEICYSAPPDGQLCAQPTLVGRDPTLGTVAHRAVSAALSKRSMLHRHLLQESACHHPAATLECKNIVAAFSHFSKRVAAAERPQTRRVRWCDLHAPLCDILCNDETHGCANVCLFRHDLSQRECVGMVIARVQMR